MDVQPNMQSFLSSRTLAGLAIILVSAFFAGLVPGALERTLIMLVGGMLAIALFALQESEGVRIRKHSALENTEVSIGDHAQFDTLISGSPDPILLIEHARIIRANPAAVDLFGKELVGQNIRLAIRHAGAIERLTDPATDHNGHAFPVDGLGRRDQHWEMRIRPLAEEVKLLFLREVTAERSAERMRADFVANASHELLTPLASIKGFLETLREPDADADPETRARFLKIMGQEADRMQALIRDLISLSRIEAEGHELVMASLALDEVVETAVAPLRSGSDPRGADIQIPVPTPLPAMEGERGQLELLISNLVANAMKYGAAGTPITIGLEPTRSGRMVCLTVSDQGEGIPPEHVPRLTERFYRVDSGRSRAVGGTGLGLSLVKHIVERHRGHLEIRSKLGVGTTISARLPVAE